MEADDVAVLQLLEQADLAEGGGGDALGRSCFNRCSLHNAKKIDLTSSSSSSLTRLRATISCVSLFLALNTVPYVPKMC